MKPYTHKIRHFFNDSIVPVYVVYKIMKKIDRLVCVEDFAQEAKQVLAKNAKDYFTSGADDEITVVQNTEAFSR